MDSIIFPMTKSVSDIVGMFTGRKDDNWKLAIVQRDIVWDEYRMARLLDSLLAGYPIGTIIICKTTKTSYILEKNAHINIRHSIEAPNSQMQMLDGQQRIYAFKTIFSDKGGNEHFFLHLSAKRPPELKINLKDPKIFDYITFLTNQKDEDRFAKPKGSNSDRNYWLDLRKLEIWQQQEQNPPYPINDNNNIDEWRQWVKQIDESCCELIEKNEEIFLHRIKKLVALWEEKNIPVQVIEVETSDDVLQVYSRLNMEGVRTTGYDLFFAAVRTQWYDAEESLDLFRNGIDLLDRMMTLRIIARLTSYKKNNVDIIPLDIGRLRGDSGKELINEMNVTIKNKNNRIRHNFITLNNFLIDDSGIGYGLNFVNDHLLDHLFGWAANQNNLSYSSLHEAVAYLLGATVCGYYIVFRDGFDRLAMKSAIESGEKGNIFPLIEILKQCKEEWHDGNYNRKSIYKFKDPSLIESNYKLLLSIAQSIPYKIPENRQVAWDHIYAVNLSKRMKWRGSDDTWKLQFYEDKNGKRLCDYIWDAGNFCALDCRLNSMAQDERPKIKLEKLFECKYLDKDIGEPITLWPEDLFINKNEIDLLFEADKFLENKKVANAVEPFKQYVKMRSNRMWDKVKERYPLLQNFNQY